MLMLYSSLQRLLLYTQKLRRWTQLLQIIFKLVFGTAFAFTTFAFWHGFARWFSR